MRGKADFVVGSGPSVLSCVFLLVFPFKKIAVTPLDGNMNYDLDENKVERHPSEVV